MLLKTWKPAAKRPCVTTKGSTSQWHVVWGKQFDRDDNEWQKKELSFSGATARMQWRHQLGINKIHFDKMYQQATSIIRLSDGSRLPSLSFSAFSDEVNDDRIDKLIRRVQGESDRELRTKAGKLEESEEFNGMQRTFPRHPET